MAEIEISKAKQALVGLRDGMRFSYENIKFDVFQQSDLLTSVSTLCRIYKHDAGADPRLEKALVKVHNLHCKRGDKIK